MRRLAGFLLIALVAGCEQDKPPQVPDKRVEPVIHDYGLAWYDTLTPPTRHERQPVSKVASWGCCPERPESLLWGYRGWGGPSYWPAFVDTMLGGRWVHPQGEIDPRRVWLNSAGQWQYGYLKPHWNRVLVKLWVPGPVRVYDPCNYIEEIEAGLPGYPFPEGWTPEDCE